MPHVTKITTLIASLLAALEIQAPPKALVDPFEAEINDGGMVFAVKTTPQSVAALLAREGVILSETDIVYPDPKEQVRPGLIITIVRAIPIVLTDGKQKAEILTHARTIKMFLNEQGIVLNEKDSLWPSLNETITPYLSIVITRITEKDIVRRLTIASPAIFENNPNMSYGKTARKTEGTEGEKEETVRITYKNGEPIKEHVLSTRVIRDPKPNIYKRGTKIEIGRIAEGRASWYCPRGPLKIKTGLTAASRDFSRGTFLRVTNRDTGKSVIVEVTDWVQNPKVIIDLWCTAFKEIASLNRGVIPVKVEEIL